MLLRSSVCDSSKFSYDLFVVRGRRVADGGAGSSRALLYRHFLLLSNEQRASLGSFAIARFQPSSLCLLATSRRGRNNYCVGISPAILEIVGPRQTWHMNVYSSSLHKPSRAYHFGNLLSASGGLYIYIETENTSKGYQTAHQTGKARGVVLTALYTVEEVAVGSEGPPRYMNANNKPMCIIDVENILCL